MVAWELDLGLRRRRPDGDGLDEVFRLLWKRHAGTDEGFTEADVLDAIAEVGDDELAAQVDARVGQRVLPALDTAVDAVGLLFHEDDGSTPPDLGVSP
jgi:predicted metalloprotease with PDZ domain